MFSDLMIPLSVIMERPHCVIKHDLSEWEAYWVGFEDSTMSGNYFS